MRVGIWAAVGGVAAAIGPVLGGLLVAGRLALDLPRQRAGRDRRADRGHPPPPLSPPVRESRPDLLGSLVLMAGIAAITLGLVKAPAWGWASAATIGSLAAGVILLAVFVRRSARHASPVLELDLFRVRAFAASTVALLLFSASFAAMLLSVLVWAQTVWGWSALRAGIAFAPGPLMVPIFAIAAGRIGHRVPAGVIAITGCVAFAAGAAYWVVAVEADAHYASAMLPGTLLTGIGVGLTLPTLTAIGATSLPQHRFATGSAVIQMSRQVGYTLGVAVLVAVLGTHSGSADQVRAFPPRLGGRRGHRDPGRCRGDDAAAQDSGRTRPGAGAVTLRVTRRSAGADRPRSRPAPAGSPGCGGRRVAPPRAPTISAASPRTRSPGHSRPAQRHGAARAWRGTRPAEAPASAS